MTSLRSVAPAQAAWREAARWLLVLPPVLVSFAIVAFGTNPPAAEDPLSYLSDTSTGVILAIAGVLLWSRRPGRRIGPLLVAASYLWYVGSLFVIAPPDSLVPYLGFVLRGYYDAIIAFVVLAFPADRLGQRSERIAVGLLVSLMLILSAWRLVATPPGFGPGYAPFGPESPLLLVRDIEVTLTVNAWLDLAIGLTLAWIALIAVRKWAGLTSGARSLAGPALAGGAAWAAIAAFSLVASFTDIIIGFSIVPSGPVLNAITYSVRILAPIGILLSVSRLRSRSTSVVEIVAGSSGPPTGGELERALRSVFNDPSLALAYPAAAGWVGTDGQAVDLDHLTGSRVATVVATPGTPGVAIVHDELLLDEPALVRTLTAVVGLAVDNERLQDDLRHQLEEVKASRARIAEAADAERRRVERDLHDGAQQRLVALLVSLRTITARLGPDPDPAVTSELDAAAAEVRAAIAEVRELAQGLDPAIVREAGLAAAIRSLADKSAIPVALDVALDARLPSRVETTAYFVVSEALANAAKHSGADGIVVHASVDAGMLRLVVSDNGAGGADPEGHGLRGLADRIAAVDGQITFTSTAGQGTIVEACIPCAS